MATGGDSETCSPEVHNICDSCHQDGKQKDAEYYCEECSENLCSDCNEAHGRVSITRGHKVTKVHAQNICNCCHQDGEQKNAEYYCEECSEYLCSNCKEAHRRVSITRRHKLTKVNVVSNTSPELIKTDEMLECKPCNTDGDDKPCKLDCDDKPCKPDGNDKPCKPDDKPCKTDGYDKQASHNSGIQTVISQNNQDVILDLSPQLISKVNVKVANDKDVPLISGCTFLSSGEHLLCDHRNLNIKLFNRSLTVSDSIQIVSRPWDIAVVNDKTAIVTMPYVKQLQYVDLVPKLSLGSKLSTKWPCWGIVVVNKLIYVTCHGGPGSNPGGDIRILDLRGNALKTIGRNRDGSRFLKRPYYIAANREGNKLYVTDYKKGEIICMSPTDNMIYKLKDADIISPEAVYVDSKDNLLVCSRDTDTVQVIASNGTKYKNLLTSYDGVQKPLGVAFRPADSTLIVSLSKQSEVLAVKLA